MVQTGPGSGCRAPPTGKICRTGLPRPLLSHRFRVVAEFPRRRDCGLNMPWMGEEDAATADRNVGSRSGVGSCLAQEPTSCSISSNSTMRGGTCAAAVPR